MPTEQLARPFRAYYGRKMSPTFTILLVAMNFRLNQKHLDKPEGAKRRSAKTRAKEKVYDHINQRIRSIYPNFNIGVTTGTHGDRSNRWRHEYRHWNFKTGKKWK